MNAHHPSCESASPSLPWISLRRTIELPAQPSPEQRFQLEWDVSQIDIPFLVLHNGFQSSRQPMRQGAPCLLGSRDALDRHGRIVIVGGDCPGDSSIVEGFGVLMRSTLD